MSIEGLFNCLSRSVESSVLGINRQFVLGGIRNARVGIQSMSVLKRVQATDNFRGIEGPEPRVSTG